MAWSVRQRGFRFPTIGTFMVVGNILGAIFGGTTIALAQSVTVPTTNPTQTIVTQQGQQITITGGTAAQQNLFHTFQQFNVNTGESVTFDTRAYPTLANVLANVSGGDPSVINGQISLIGSHANLFLINPAGLVFGSNASLNLPASFTATTASEVGFGDRGWTTANAQGMDYQSFVSAPTGFRFGNSGSVVNGGNLSVNPGQNLLLLGRNVINFGELQAPQGEVLMMAALPQQEVRLSAPNMILGLEVVDRPLTVGGRLNPLDLPTLLTVGASALGTQPTLTIAADGTAAIVSGSVNTAGDNTGANGGHIAILGDRVTVLNSRIDASGNGNGGQINIGGNFQGKGNLPNSSQTFINTGSEILADSRSQGNGGQVIVWSNGWTGFGGKVSVRGGPLGGSGGFVEISGKQNLTFGGTVDLAAPQGTAGTLLLDPADIVISGSIGSGSVASGDREFTSLGGNVPNTFTPTSGEPFTLSQGTLEGFNGNVILAATNSITFQPLTGATLTLAGGLTLNAGGNITLTPTDTIVTGGAIDLTGGSLLLGNLTSGSNVTLTSTIGDISVGTVNASSGLVAMTSANQLTLNGSITSRDDTLSPFNFPPAGYSNASGTINLITAVPPTGTNDLPPADEQALVEDLNNDPALLEGFDTFADTATALAPDEGGDVLAAENNTPPEDQGPGGPEVDLGPDRFQAESNFDDTAYAKTDTAFDTEFSEALNLGNEKIEGAPQTLADTQAALTTLAKEANTRSAIVYVNFTPSTTHTASTTPGASPANPANASTVTPDGVKVEPTDDLELIVVTREGQPLRRVLRGVTRTQVQTMASLLRQTVGTPEGLASNRYLVPAERFYKWLIGSIEPELKAQNINNLLFALPAGLRSLPLAALYDGKQFVIEKYSIGLTPSVQLTDLRYKAIQDAKLVALGSEQFTNQAPLPAVPIEVKTITQQIWPGDVFLNQAFTLKNLLETRENGHYGIIHLATHADFESGNLNQSYIQLWDTRLLFNQLRQLRFNQGTPVELLVLSACRTALGNDQAELGFAGLAVQAGVKSTLASLWYVSDEGTLGLMTEFYRQLRDPQVRVKAEALRRAQLALLHGEIHVASGQLRGPSFRGSGITLPAEVAARGTSDLTHPYYWAAFTLVGNPW